MEQVIKIHAIKKLGEFNLDAYFEFPSGYSVVLGPSGSGKTTLLRIMAGLDKSDGGFMEYDGLYLFDEGIFVPPQKRELAIVFQEENLLPHLNVEQNIRFALKGRCVSEEEIAEAFEYFRINGLLKKYPEELSGGERQRVAIARAFLRKPRYILMDEPFSSLDFSVKFEIIDVLKEKFKTDIPVILVTHDPLEALTLGSKFFILDRGRKVDEGGKEVVKDYFGSYIDRLIRRL